MDNRIDVRIDNETKRKALFVLKSKGKNLSDEVRKVVEKFAKEYDQKNSK